MIDIFKDLNEKTVGEKVWSQGTAPAELPESFYTVINDYTGDNLNADNKECEIVWEWTVIFYTKDFSLLYSGIEKVKSLLKSKGYIVRGSGYDFNGKYDSWEARAIDVKKIEYTEV